VGAVGGAISVGPQEHIARARRLLDLRAAAGSSPSSEEAPPTLTGVEGLAAAAAPSAPGSGEERSSGGSPGWGQPVSPFAAEPWLSRDAPPPSASPASAGDGAAAADVEPPPPPTGAAGGGSAREALNSGVTASLAVCAAAWPG
jgi:hypothetical protein